MGLGLVGVSYVYALRNGLPRETASSLKDIGKTFFDALPSMFFTDSCDGRNNRGYFYCN